MKKTIILLLALCLLGGAAAGVLTAGERALPESGVIGGADGPTGIVTGTQPAEPEELTPELPAPAPEEPEAEEPETVEPALLDYGKLYANHEPDEVVARVSGREIPWKYYCYLLMSEANQVEGYFTQMASYYGLSMSWSDPAYEEGGESYAQVAAENARQTLLQVEAIRDSAMEYGVELSEEDRAEIREQVEQAISATCGEDGTEEDFNAYLESIYLDREVFDQMNEVSQLYREGFVQRFGAQGEKLDDETAMNWLRDNEYLACTHILLMSIDPETFTALEGDALSAKRNKAAELAAELQAIEDPQERLARFKELKAEYCEDSGKETYPDGYVFRPGTMVAAFEEAAKGLEEYQVSDPVESNYGFHVIMRLPLDPDAVIDFSSGGSAMTARSYAANDVYAEELQQRYEAMELEYAEGFTPPDLTLFVEQKG